MKQKGLDEVRKTKKQWIRAMLSIAVSMLLVLSGLPMGGLREAYAAPNEPKVTDVYFNAKPGENGSIMELILEGNYLKDAEVTFDAKPFGDPKFPGYGKRLLNKENQISFENIDPQIFKGSEIKFSVTNKVGTAEIKTYFSSIPEVFLSTKKSVYTKEDYEILGKKLLVNHPKKEKVIYQVGTAFYEDKDAPDKIEITEGKVTIKGEYFTPHTGKNQIMLIKIDFQKHTDTETKSHISYTVEGLTIKEKFPNLDGLKIIPNEGYYEGGDILNIFAWDKGKPATSTTPEIPAKPILDKDVFGDNMRVRLEKKVPGKPAVHVDTNFVGLKKMGGKNVILVVETKGIKKEDIYDGYYDVIIYNKDETPYEGQKRFQEAIEENGFKYVDRKVNMTVSDVRPPKAKDDETPLVRISGRDILNIDRLPMLSPTTPSTEKIIFKPDPLKGVLDNNKPPVNKEKYLSVDYKLPAGGATFEGIDVESIYRKISVQIGAGADAKPVEKEIVTTDPGIEDPPTDQEPHFINQKAKDDKIIFRLKNTDADLKGKDVIVRTETYIKLVRWTEPLVLTGQAKWDKKFIIEPSKIPPVITSIEPLYGYYNNLGALGLDQGESIDKAKMKPLLVRVKGKNFQVKRVEKGGSVRKVYPAIEIWDNEGTNAKPIEEAGKKVFGGTGDYSTKVLKVLKENGREVTGQNDDIFGEIMLIQIAPENPLYKLSPNIATTSSGGTYKFNANIVVVQDYGTNKNDVRDGKQKPFEFRYRNVGAPGELRKQPQIVKVLRVGANSKNTERVFLSDEENEVTVYFPNLDPSNKIKATLDGMLLNNGADFKVERDPLNDGYSFIKARLPKGMVGKTKLQIISDDGLMDSYDLEFQSSDRPLIADLIPNEGQAGTWVFLKGDPKGQPFEYKTEPKTKVFFDNVPVPATVKDSRTIIFQVPKDKKAGDYEVRLENPNGAKSPAKIFKVLFDPGQEPERLKLDSIDPNRATEVGGIPTTIRVKEGKLSKDDEVYFGSQLATIIGTDLNFTKLYVIVPKFKEVVLETGESYTVPVTVKKKSGVTDTIQNGFTYYNPPDLPKLLVREVYKEDVLPKTNKGNAGDRFWVEGDHFLAKINGKTAGDVEYPEIYFGYEKAKILQKYTPADKESETTKIFPRILVEVPKQTSGLKADGAVDVMVINPNGATNIKKGAFIYGKGSPQILSKNLQASRFNGQVKISAKEVFKNPLVIFGDKVDEKDISSGQPEDLLTTHSEIEQIVVKYLGEGTDTFEIHYKKPDGSTVLMTDATDGGRIKLRNSGSSRLVKINWRNPIYHQNSRLAENRELLNRLNDEYMLLEIVSENQGNKLVVKRGIGFVKKYDFNAKENVANMLVLTPYHEKIDKTKVTVLNTDGSFADAPFTFTDSFSNLEITDIEGSVSKKVKIDGKEVTAKVKTQVISKDGTIKILGKNLKDIDSIDIGGKEVKMQGGYAADYSYIIVEVPKGEDSLEGKPLPLSIYSAKEGNDFSDEKNPPIYFMYIVAGSDPVIESVKPESGPRTGGTFVKVTGSGFREKDAVGLKGKVTVSVNGSAPIDIFDPIYNEKTKELTGFSFIAPPSIAGPAKVRVINADGGTSDPADFTYISQPEIKKVKSLSTIDEAGENWVEVTGEDFQEGAKVYIGGQLKKYGKKPEKATASGMGKAVDGKNTVNYLIGGTEVKDVEVKGPNLLRFKLPKDVADIQADKVTILNPDTGISEPKEFSPFDVPLIAELVPNKGPVGSFVWIKGDPAGQPFQYQNPPFTKVRWKGEKNTGGIILPAEVKDAHNILIRVPHEWSKGQKIEPGEYEISVINTLMENGKKVEKESPSMFFEVIKTDDEIELASIDPTKGDIAGGIPATIKAKKGKFSAEDKVYFGSQEASIAGMNPAGNELYVIVPKLTEKVVKKGESLPVTVTVQKKSGATGSLIDGFVYYNTGDSEKVQITAIYKHGTTEKTKTGKGHPKDIFWIEGNHFLIRTEGTPEKVAYPDIYIGFEKAEVLGDYLPPEVKNGRILNKIPIRIPERTKFKDTAGQNNNTVDVTLINPDGSSAVLKDGFTYLQDRPAILTKDLEASRFDGKIKVETEHMPQDNYVIFGEDAKNPDRFGLGIREEQFTTKHSEIEKIVIKYLGPEKGKDNFEIYYQNPDGSLLLMGDATDGGRITLQKPGDRKLVKINWKNPDYHKNTKIAQNPNLLNKIHDEYMLLERIQDSNHEMQILQVRRGIGVVDSRRVTDPQKSRATLMISTPYHERAEKTTMTIVGKNDESLSAEAPIRFTEPLIGEMEITDIEDSVLTKIEIDGKPVEAKVKKININQAAIVKVYGKKFGDKETTKVTVGVQGDAVKVNLLEIGENEDYMILELPKVPDALRNKPLSVDVFSKNGNDFSSKKKPPIYLMFVQGAPGPDNLKIDPAKGPRTGGTRVTITGKGFKEMDSVGVPGSIKYSLDGERALPVSRVVKDTKGNITALEIVMPARKVGEARLQIINADGGVSPIQKFQYISQPQISNVSGSVFAKEGTEIRVSGYDFQPGAKVTISGKLEPIKDGEGELMKGVVAGKNQYFKITGGTAISDVTVEGGNIIKFKLPKRESAENNNIIIQNPDGGVTDIGSGKIAPPIPEVPVITASPGAEGSVILSWKVDQDTLNKAKKFEIYAKLSGDSEYTFVGDTMQNKTNQAFVVKGLEHDQNYDFKVRVLNDTGEAKDFGIVHGFTLSAADDYKEEEKQQEVDRMVKKIETQGKQEIVGNVVRYTVGSGDSVVDLSKHTKYKNKQVQIPAWELKNHRGKTLHIIDGNMNLRVSYASLFTPELAAASSDALVRIHIASADSKKEGALRKAIGRNKSRLSPIYKVDFEVVDPKKTQKIKQLAGRANIGISASKGQAGYIAIYVEAEDKFQKLPNAAISKGGYYVLLRDKNE